MKKIIIYPMIMIILAVSVFATIEQDLVDSVVLYAPFDDVYDTRCYVDLSIYNNSGICANGTAGSIPTNISGVVGSGLSFDGTSDSVSIPHTRDYIEGKENFTVMFWYQPHAKAGWNNFFGVWKTTGNDRGISLRQIDGTTTFGITNNGEDELWENAPALTDDYWYLVVFMRNRTSTSDNFYYSINASSGSWGSVKTDDYTIKNIGYQLIGTMSLINDSPTAYSQGAIDELYIFNRSLTGEEIEYMYNDFNGKQLNMSLAYITPTDIQVEWDSLTPLNDTGVNGNFTMQYNVSVDSTTIQNCSLYTNGVLNQTNTSVNIGLNQFYIEVGGSETLTAYVECYSSDEDYNTTSTKLIEVDIISPDVTINTPSKEYVQDILLDFNAIDTEGNLFAYEINISASNGTTMFHANDSNLGLASYNYSYILSLASFPVGTYNMVVNISDSHTNYNIKDYKPKINLNDKKIEYETDAGIVNVELNNLDFYDVGDLITPVKKNKKNAVNKITSEKVKDMKYKFGFETDIEAGEEGMIYAFDLLIDNPNVRKVQTTTYNAHYIIGQGIGTNWIDCESESIVKTEERVENGQTYITLFSDDPLLECNSIGGLNFDGAEITFDVVECGSWTCNQYSTCNTSDERACTNVTGSPAEYCNNTIYVDNGGDYNGLEGACDYCTEDIETTITNSTCANSELTQTTTYSDLNYGTCCAVTGITTDCSIENATLYTNGTVTLNCQGYPLSYTTSDLAPIVIDGVGTAGASFVGWIPLLVLGTILVLLTGYYVKIRKRV